MLCCSEVKCYLSVTSFGRSKELWTDFLLVEYGPILYTIHLQIEQIINWCMVLHVHKDKTATLQLNSVANEFVSRNRS